MAEKHNVTTDEVEEVLFSEPHTRRAEKGRVKDEDLYVAYGQTRTGRYLIVFFIHKPPAATLPISARDMSQAERRYDNDQKKPIDPIPEEFTGYEEAAEFWDTHDTTDAPDAYRTVDVETGFRGRYYEIESAEDVVIALRKRAQELGVSISDPASRLLRQELSTAGS